MTPTKCAALLRQHQEWRRFDGEWTDSPPMLDPKVIGQAIDAAIRIIERSDGLLAALERIAAGREMEGQFTHSEAVHRYQKIARDAVAGATGGES
jgi:hypothetical protein